MPSHYTPYSSVQHTLISMTNLSCLASITARLGLSYDHSNSQVVQSKFTQVLTHTTLKHLLTNIRLWIFNRIDLCSFTNLWLSNHGLLLTHYCMIVGMSDLLVSDCLHEIKIMNYVLHSQIWNSSTSCIIMLIYSCQLIPRYVAEHLWWVTLSTESKWTDVWCTHRLVTLSLHVKCTSIKITYPCSNDNSVDVVINVMIYP